MSRLGPFVVRHRVAILAATAVVVGLACAALPRLRIDAGARSLLFVDPEVQRTFERYVSEWGGDRFLAVTLELPAGDVFTARRLAALRQLTRRLAALPGVARAESLTNATVPAPRGDGVQVGPLVPEPVPAAPAALATLRQRTLASPLLHRVLWGDGGRLVTVNLWLRHSDDDVQVVVRTTRQIEALIREPAGVAWTPRVIGGPVVVRAVFDITLRDVWVLSVAPFLLVGLLLFGVTRSVRAALLPLSCVAATGMATFGVMAATGHGINLVTSMLPMLIMVISVADVVHLLVQFHAARAGGLPGADAVAQATSRVALPCLLTSLTTAVGFGSLALADIPQVRHFGLFAAVGIAFAFVFAVFAVPAALAVLPAAARPRPRPARLEAALVRLAMVGYRRPVAVVLLFLGISAVGGYGITRLQVESSALRFLPASHPVLRDLAAVEPRLMGTMALIVHLWDRHPGQRDVAGPARPLAARAGAGPAPGIDADEVLDDPEDRPAPYAPRLRTAGRERLRDPAVLDVLEGFAAHMGKEPGVKRVLSIADYLKELHRVMMGGDPRHFRLPKDAALIASYLDLAGSQDRRTLSHLLNFERSAANVTVMCIAHSSATMARITAAARAYFARPAVRRALGPDLAVDVTGYAPLLSHVSDRIVATQLESCFLALGIIGLMLVVVLWSLRAGLLAMVPNVLPIVVTVGVMGWTGVTLNITTVMLASIALGIAVDDTIHVMVHLRRSRAAGADPETALGATYASVGPALVFTTVVITGGFLILLAAVLIPARHLGLLTALTMVTALGADLVLLPSLVRLGRPWRRFDGARCEAPTLPVAPTGVPGDAPVLEEPRK